MAKQVGIMKITGTIDDITFYKMGGIYYARMKSCLTGKRFWKDKAFEGSRKSALALGQASRLASKLYKTFTIEVKSRSLFCKLTGEIKLLIKTGHTEEEITSWFLLVYHDVDLITSLAVALEHHAFVPAIEDLRISLLKRPIYCQGKVALQVLKE